MSVRNLDAILKPRSVAVIGASARPHAVGHMVLDNIMRGGFSGPVYPVNPRGGEIDGQPVFTDIAALPQCPDLAIITTPADAVPAVIAELGVGGTRGAVVITAGFGEGAETQGRARLTAVLEAAQPHLMRIVGPNCFGVIAPHRGLNASFARGAPPPGGIAFVTQSGAIMATLMDWAAPRGIGFSAAVSLGDMGDVDFGDMLDWLALDAATSAIVLYVEAITHPRKFMSAARAAARVKPVIVIKSGRHAAAAKAATSHTGALAGVDAVYDAAFARAGLLRVRTMQQVFDTVALLAIAPQVRGDRLAIITNGGGAGVLAVDDLLDANGQLAALRPETYAALNRLLPPTWSHGNPVDIIGDADAARFVGTIDTVAADANVDAVLVMFCPTAVSDPLAVAEAIAEKAPPKPLLTAWLGEASVAAARTSFVRAHIPTFATPDGAIEGFTNLVRFQKRRAALMEAPAAAAIVPRTNVAAVAHILSCNPGDLWLSSEDVRELLRLYGIPANPSVRAATPTDAAAAAEALKAPVALKIRSPDIVHKSDVGGVILNLTGAATVRAAAESMLRQIAGAVPQARIDGFSVEPMVSRSQAWELLLGVTTDPTFGLVVAFGRGGTEVEVIGDKALGLPPLNLNLARDMIAETQVGKLLRGYRDHPPARTDAIAQALVALSQLVTDHERISDLDINPLLADATEIIAIDARIKVTATPATRRLVISPYPIAIEQTLRLRDGTEMFLRPLRPEDEDRIHALVSALTPEDRHFRFFSPLRGLGHATAARLCQIDYDREMALIAFPASDREAAWGVGRMHADPDNERAEFAVTVASARQGNGLGYGLLKILMEIAAARGIHELWGQVLRTNRRMLEVCGALGFSLTPDREDRQIIICSRAPRQA